MFLAIITFVVIGPLMVICGWVAIIDEIKRKNHLGEYKDNNGNQSDKSVVRHEKPQEEDARVEEYGLDDDWGILK